MQIRRISLPDQARWPTQGESVVVSERNVYLNSNSLRFIKHDDIFALIAAKGMGKTLLLKYKRQTLQETAGTSGLTIIPHNRELDYVRLSASLSDAWLDHLTSSSTWQSLWELSIVLSIVFHCPNAHHSPFLAECTQHLLNSTKMPRALRESLSLKVASSSSMPLNPSQILSILLSLSPRDFQIFRQESFDSLYQSYTQLIHHGFAIFVDSFDQTLSETFPYSQDIWVNGQLGLLTAAWELNRQNRHIKVYSSIRQEAYADFKGENRLAMQGSILVLQYEQDEVQSILDKQVLYYDGMADVAALAGLSVVRNQRVMEDEVVFPYIYRHTFGTPRGVTCITRELSFSETHSIEDASARECKVRDIVNRMASRELFDAYLEGEMSSFLSFLGDRTALESVFNMIPKNVLTYQDLERLRKNMAAELHRTVERTHPFCELFNIGVIGAVRTSRDGDKMIQYFRKPFEFDWKMEGVLPKSDFYLIHPAAQQKMRMSNPKYCSFQNIIIGDGYPWKNEYTDEIRRQTKRVFLSYCSKDAKTVGLIYDTLAGELDRLGVPHDIWLDRWRVRGGHWIQESVEEGLSEAEIVVVVISKNSLASGWVQREWRTKFEQELQTRKLQVLPVCLGRLPSSDIPELIRGKKYRVLQRRLEGDLFRSKVGEIAEDVVAMAAQHELTAAA